MFWVFDNDGNGEVDHKELISGFEMLKQNSLEEKLNFFFELCDKNKSGTIDKKEFYDSIKESLVDYQDWADLKDIISKIFDQVDIDGSGELTKSELLKACQNDTWIKSIVFKN